MRCCRPHFRARARSAADAHTRPPTRVRKTRPPRRSPKAQIEAPTMGRDRPKASAHAALCQMPSGVPAMLIETICPHEVVAKKCKNVDEALVARCGEKVRCLHPRIRKSMSHVGKTLPAVFIALLWTSVSANAQPIGT